LSFLLLVREPAGVGAQVVVVLQEALQEGGPVAAAAARAVEELVVGNRGLLQAQLRRLPPLPPGVDALAKARAGRRPGTWGCPRAGAPARHGSVRGAPGAPAARRPRARRGAPATRAHSVSWTGVAHHRSRRAWCCRARRGRYCAWRSQRIHARPGCWP
jgi:hypothetical protein